MKRPLGLGKNAKSKKQRSVSGTASPAEPSGAGEAPAAENELTVELGEEIAAADTMAQLLALWRNFVKAQDRNELMVNGVIHECDRILRKVHARENTGEAKGEANGEGKGEANGEGKDGEEEEDLTLSGEFYAIYGLALSSLGFFHTEDSAKVQEFYSEARDRIETGKAKFPGSVELLFAEARVLINEIPLTSISPLTVESIVSTSHKDVALLLDRCLAVWEDAEAALRAKNEYHHYNFENLDFLQALDDLLDMVDNFGRETVDGQDSGDEDSENNDDNELVLGPDHPLFVIGKTDKYNLWWRKHTELFLENLDRRIAQDPAPDSLALRRQLCKRLGQLFLLEAEEPTNIFTTLTYYKKDMPSMNGMTREEARAASQSLLRQALDHLKQAQDEDEPDTWAAVAEALISLGNTYDLDSPDQDTIYKEAEGILTRANNATNGRYEAILENLVQG